MHFLREGDHSLTQIHSFDGIIVIFSLAAARCPLVRRAKHTNQSEAADVGNRDRGKIWKSAQMGIKIVKGREGGGLDT